MTMPLDRQRLTDDPALAGLDLCRALSDRTDEWLQGLFAAAIETQPDLDGRVALVAVGGYGRRELSPESDLDLLLVVPPREDVSALAQALWYPIWDEGVKLGHAVRTVKEALSLASTDLDTATSLLALRHVAGDLALTEELRTKATALWEKRARRWLGELSTSVRQRHASAGDTAFLLEPDLKDGRGGLRDVHAIAWAEQARSVMLEGDLDALAGSYEVLLAARVEQHRRTGRPGNVLLLQDQDAVADALGLGDADELMAEVSAAARTIAWRSDEVWERVDASLAGPVTHLLRRDRSLAEGVVLRDGRVHLTAAADPAVDPLLVLRVAVGAARTGARIDRGSLERLVADAPPLPFPWSEEARALFADIWLAGEGAIDVVEALDQRGLWVRLLPEWEPVRSKPQRNAYHTYTVDRHLCVAATNASKLVDQVDRPDLLVVGALLHDIGKGYPGDHTEVGIEVVDRIGRRMGFDPEDVAILVDMVRHHLLLPDVATRRDLTDDATIDHVAELVGTRQRLDLLAALTEADSTATGPAAWNSWKAGLVRQLAERVRHVLDGGRADEVTPTGELTDHHRALLAAGELAVEADGETLTVVAPDRPGLFSRVAGVLALHGLDVLSAEAHSDGSGMALEVLRVESPTGPIVNWEPVRADLERALDGRLALAARLAERARTYGRGDRHSPAVAQPDVRIHNDLTEDATVVEVVADDSVGVLWRITRAIAELDLDIRSAKVQTLGPQVVDSFYLVDSDGRKLTDDALLAEVARALRHTIET
ncbi:MAG: [protein-PII] uridylyltransferase [Acidimicrobiia bacterium]|nr:[protein-PII] uridylyltransferase [Acidimicrobiia bacterium]